MKIWAKTEKIKENAVPFHDVIDKKDSYRNRRLPFQNRKSLKKCKLIWDKIWSGGKNAGGKYEGILHDVDENKWWKNVRNTPFHDVDENKELKVLSPRYV